MKEFIVFKAIPQDFYTVLVASLNIGVNNETEEQIKKLRDDLEKLEKGNVMLINKNYNLNNTIFNYKFGIWIFFILFVLIISFILVCVR